MKKNITDIKGFTLVELSITMLIIGLLVSATLVGAELIHAAKVRTTASLYKRYSAAANTFLAKYNYLPGDMAPAIVDIFQLYRPSHGICLDPNTGNNNDHPAFPGQPRDGCERVLWVTNGTGRIERLTREQGNFFQHLSMAGMIEGNYTYSGWGETGDESATWGEAPLDTIFFPDNDYTYMNGTGGSGKSTFLLGVSVQSIWNGGINIPNAFDHFRPDEAYGLDSKIDNGDPFTGQMIAINRYAVVGRNQVVGFVMNETDYATSQNCCSVPFNDCQSANAEYDVSTTDQRCTIQMIW